MIDNPRYDPSDSVAREVFERVRGRHVLVLTDFDGTLSEIAPTPGEAHVAAAVQAEMAALASIASVTFGVVSGRREEDVRRRVGAAAMFVAGLHGLEIVGPGCQFRHPGLERITPVIARLTEEGRARLGWCPGLLLENKTYALTCHVRLAPPELADRALGEFEELAAPDLESGVLRALPGSMVVELLPAVGWHKGRACEWIRDHVKSRVHTRVALVYLGDDRTDEDAFAVLHDDDMVIGIGERPHAELIDWRLAGPASVGRFFGRLAQLLAHGTLVHPVA